MTPQGLPIAAAILMLAAPAWADVESQESGGRPEAAPVAMQTSAQGSSTSYSSDIGYRGWGLRVGLTDDPDQVVGGAHFNMGEFVPHLRFQPDLQFGVGDHHTTLYATAPVYYRFGTETRFTPYAGGGVSVGFVDRDLPSSSNADDSEFEVGAKVTGGLEWPGSRGRAFFLELSLGFADIHDATILAGWFF